MDHLTVRAVTCGAYTSQFNWSYSNNGHLLMWNELCATMVNNSWNNWPPILEECTDSQGQQWFVHGLEIRKLYPDYPQIKCLGVHKGYTSLVDTGDCSVSDAYWSWFGLDWARQSLHLQTYKNWKVVDGRVENFNGQCLDVWQGNRSVGTQVAPTHDVVPMEKQLLHPLKNCLLGSCLLLILVVVVWCVHRSYVQCRLWHASQSTILDRSTLLKSADFVCESDSTWQPLEGYYIESTV